VNVDTSDRIIVLLDRQSTDWGGQLIGRAADAGGWLDHNGAAEIRAL